MSRSNKPAMNWDERYSATEGYLFGEAPNAFLARQAHLITPGMRALAVADGEGRNGVWLAQQGASVLSVDGSPNALQKARKLADKKGVEIECQVEDLLNWTWPTEAFDLVVGIFIQFVGPKDRDTLFKSMKAALKPGGLLLLEGYRPKQLDYGTGGPPIAANMYTKDLLREAFSDMQILELSSYDADLDEGPAHSGMSALIDLIAKKP